jgi:hypothetical protein
MEQDNKDIRIGSQSSVICTLRNVKYDGKFIIMVTAKLSLCLTKHHTMKTYRESGGIAPRILDIGTR